MGTEVACSQSISHSKNKQILFIVSSSFFRLTTIKRGNNYEGDFCILVDGDCVVYREEDGSADNYSPQGSASINLYLAAGQVVQVENRGSTSVYGYGSYGIESWFTGFLLYAV